MAVALQSLGNFQGLADQSGIMAISVFLTFTAAAAGSVLGMLFVGEINSLVRGLVELMPFTE
jgi:hypothetical protein